MTLPAATAVAFAQAGGRAADAREWITIDIAGSPSRHRRGYAVITEPVRRFGRSQEIASHVRHLILSELRRHAKDPVDVVLVRAFAVANGFVQHEGRPLAGDDEAILIGATAVIFEDNIATVAHMPPGQLVFLQDGKTYGVPDLMSWAPHYAAPADEDVDLNPLGYADAVAPLLMQAEMLPGDAVILSDVMTGQALARHAADLDEPIPLQTFQGRSPEMVLDSVEDIVGIDPYAFSAAAVIGFPPNPAGSDIASVADVARNAREQTRRAKAVVTQHLPHRGRRAPASARPFASSAGPIGDAASPMRSGRNPRGDSFQDRLIRWTERGAEGKDAMWQPRSDALSLGAPGAHGVMRHRRNTANAGMSGVSHALPRVSLLRSPGFIGALILLLVLAGAFGWSQRDRFQPEASDYLSIVAGVDQQLVAIRSQTDERVIRNELDDARAGIADARDAGAPEDLLDVREDEIQLMQDKVDHVLRMTNVTRIGSIPDDLQNGETAAIQTPTGIFFVNGGLYRLIPDTRNILSMLQPGIDIEGVKLGHLYGLAYDGQTMVATDGKYLYFSTSSEGSGWHAISMEDINDQGAWKRGSMAAFNGNAYLLQSDYRNIYQFSMDPAQKTTKPNDWVLVGDRVSFDQAIDMTITNDGKIEVLLDDGRILTMHRGAQEASIDVPTFDPEKDTLKAIVNGSATGYLYVVIVNDDGDGRVIAMDSSGGNVSQLMLPADFSTGGSNVKAPFEGFQDMTVDEQSGTLYLINGDGIWSASYSLPVPTNEQGTPVSTPVSTPSAWREEWQTPGS